MKHRIATYLVGLSILLMSGYAFAVRYGDLLDDYSYARATFKDAVSDPRIGKVVVKQDSNAFVANDSTGKIAFANASGITIVYDLNEVAQYVAGGDATAAASIRQEISENLRENAGVIATLKDSNGNGLPDEQTTSSPTCSDNSYSCGQFVRSAMPGLFSQSFIANSRFNPGQQPPNPSYCQLTCQNLASDEENNFDAALEVMLACFTAPELVPVCLHGIYRWTRSIRRYRENYRICVYECRGTPSRW